MISLKRFCLDLKKYRHYIAFSVKSSLKAELSNTVLGYLWWLLDPMLHMVVYTFLVQFIFQRATPAFPLYVFCALLPWKVATTLMSSSTNCIRANASIIKQVYLPKFTLPLVLLMTNSIKLIFGFLLLLGMLVLYEIPFTWHIIEFLPAFIVFALFYYSLSLFFTHVGVLFEDMTHLISYLIMFWFFSSPGIWSMDQIPAGFENILWFNPNVTFFVSFRNALMYGQHPLYQELGYWLIASLFLLSLGIPMLYKSDKNYSKVI
ncbi:MULTISPECIES: ABC transporter permease [unclassified Oceanispirochaeta]|uniref:ABC transporter permease n=1 Tax=unclassified Oceanispirochaeta TaxID=2635722 RepID=UPI001C12F44B|nr:MULTISPECIES: ABC transporter permease [unclassified Oceanispirochaeta]